MANFQQQGTPRGPPEGHRQGMVRQPDDGGGEGDGQRRFASMQLRDDCLYQIKTQAELLRVAKILRQAGILPTAFRSDEQASVALQCLMSLGLNPVVSARNTTYVKGAFTLFGDLPMALVRKSGQLEAFDEFTFTQAEDQKGYLRQCFDNGNCHIDPIGAVCRVKRRDMSIHEIVYTIKQAEQAGLYAKGRRSDAPWQKFTSRMLVMRARSQALKDVFADVLMGVQIQEYDIEGVYDQPPPERVIEVQRQVSAAQREAEIERRAARPPAQRQVQGQAQAQPQVQPEAQAKPVGETGAEIVGLTPQAKRPGVASRA